VSRLQAAESARAVEPTHWSHDAAPVGLIQCAGPVPSTPQLMVAGAEPASERLPFAPVESGWPLQLATSASAGTKARSARTHRRLTTSGLCPAVFIS